MNPDSQPAALVSEIKDSKRVVQDPESGKNER